MKRPPATSRSAAAISIRAAEESDLPAIIDLDREVTGLAKAEYWHDIYARSGAPGGGQQIFLVAEVAGRLEGFVVGEIRAWEFGSPPCGWVFAIQVRPKRRLAGVATHLFEAIGACFRRAGVDRLRTMVARDNTVILSFFRSQGMMAGPFVELETTLV
jgi:GNAT superfamily N-acetyltransferase